MELARGGITHISKRYSAANNKYKKNYNPKKGIKIYDIFGCNNL